jgi:hypothetical protein
MKPTVRTHPNAVVIELEGEADLATVPAVPAARARADEGEGEAADHRLCKGHLREHACLGRRGRVLSSMPAVRAASLRSAASTAASRPRSRSCGWVTFVVHLPTVEEALERRRRSRASVKTLTTCMIDRAPPVLRSCAAICSTGWWWRRFGANPGVMGHTFAQIVRIGVHAVPMSALTALTIGVVLAMQSAAQLAKLGATMYVPGLVSSSLMRELAPLDHGGDRHRPQRIGRHGGAGHDEGVGGNRGAGGHGHSTRCRGSSFRASSPWSS